MRRELQAMAVVVLILGLGWLGYGALFGEAGGDRLVVSAVEGSVRRVDGLGTETAAEAGQALAARDRIVAGAGGKAVLSLGPDSRVTIEERSALRVVAMDQAGVRLELEGGKVQATIRPGGGTVGITADGQGVATDDGDFTVRRADDGTLAVVNTRGELAVTGVEGTARLSEGQRLVAAPGGVGLVAPASEDLLLQVAWPAATRVRETATEVHGHTEPGATVRVGHPGAWMETKADVKGEFSARVPLAEGDNEIQVEATSVLGNATRVTQMVERDTLAPAVGAEVHY